MDQVDGWKLRFKVEVLVHNEILKAEQAHGRHYASAHEAFGVLLEEVDEFKVEVWKKRSQRDRRAMVRELVQVAAVAQTFAAQILEEIGDAVEDEAD